MLAGAAAVSVSRSCAHANAPLFIVVTTWLVTVCELLQAAQLVVKPPIEAPLLTCQRYVATAASARPPARSAAAASFAAGDRYRFYVSYPLLRAPNASAEMCEDCHADRVMQHGAVEGPNVNWASFYSHPVGEALGANGKAYDRAAPLDANGAAQPGGDANPTNDLNVFGGAVRCLTCHSPHNADSNSQTTDAR